jgi:peptidoglycan/xylan/chitin deacetylase (PgdA/CDA1 family)
MSIIDLRIQKRRMLQIAALAVVLVGCGLYSVYVLEPHARFAWERVQASAMYYGRFGISPERLAVFGGADRPATVGHAEAIPVLLYHGEGKESDMPSAVFVEQLRALKAAGWQTITIEQFEDFMAGKTELPAKSFLLTFDDGRTDSFYGADPLLKDLGYTAVMYVVTEYSMPGGSDKPLNKYYLSKAELQYMVGSGRWELQSHGAMDHFRYAVPTATSTAAVADYIPGEHFLSNKFWVPEEHRLETDAEYAARVTHDLSESKKILEDTFGRPVTTFAYPYSDYGQNTVNFPGAKALLDTIVPTLYTHTFYQVSPQRDVSFNAPGMPAYRIKRFEPRADWSGQDLVRIVESASPKPLPYDSTQNGFWYSVWGTVESTDGRVELSTLNNGTGATALLAGSGLWRDYSTSAAVRATDTQSVTLIMRYADDGNKLYCTFSPTGVQLVQYVHGTQTVLDSRPTAVSFASGATIGMSAVGAYAGCRAHNTYVSATDAVDPRLRAGSAGIQIWNTQPGTARIEARDFSAVQAGSAALGKISAFLAD